MNHRWARLALAIALVASLGLASGCKRTIEVQTGTRIVDSQGKVISEDIKTVRVPPETASAYRIVTITQPDAAASEVASNYNQAQAAISAGNMALAKELLGKVIATDPTYRSAKKQYDTINAGKKPAPDTSAPSAPATSTAPPASTTPTATAGALVRWIPNVLSGFTAQKSAIDPLSVSRQYTPVSGSAASSLVIYAEQFRSSGEAKTALASQVKQRYPRSGSSQTINGHATYFGTTSGFAAIGFTSGAVMVAIEAAPVSGPPLALYSTLEQVVKQLP